MSEEAFFSCVEEMKVRVEEVEEHFFSGGGGKKSAGKIEKMFFFSVFVGLC